jgi:hypothetical protein
VVAQTLMCVVEVSMELVDETPVVSVVWAVDGIGANNDAFLAFHEVANHQVRILFGRHLLQSLGCQFTCDGPMDLVVELVGSVAS